MDRRHAICWYIGFAARACGDSVLGQAPEQRQRLLEPCLDDIALLETVLGESFADWRSSTGRGSFKERVASR